MGLLVGCWKASGGYIRVKADVSFKLNAGLAVGINPGVSYNLKIQPLNQLQL